MNTTRGNLYKQLFQEADLPEDADAPVGDETLNIDSMDMDAMDYGDDDDELMGEPVAPPGFENSPYAPLSDPAVDDRPIVQTTQIDISGFGSDTSDIHNEYDPKEIDRLNTLIASENSAIGEYFTASKETNVDVLRRLYSDIGEEERFHSEQLIFAKSQLTGEKYIPRDPDVKKEYEELLAMGMDEETAMATAIDKVGLMPRSDVVEVTPEQTLEECAQILATVEMIEDKLYQEAMLALICSSPAFTTADRDASVCVMLESYYNIGPTAEVYLEAMGSVADTPQKEVKVIENPIKVVIRWLGNIIKLIRKLGHNLAIWATKMRERRKDKWDWIKRHGGIKSLFQANVGFYFYVDTQNESHFEFGSAVQYNRMLMHLAAIIAGTINQNGGNVKFNENGVQFRWEENTKAPRQFTTIDEGLELIHKVNMYPTRVQINTPEKENYLAATIFGYHERKINSGVKTEVDAEGKTVTTRYDESENIYNIMKLVLEDTTNCLEAVETLSKTIGSQQASIKPDVFNQCTNALKDTTKAFSVLISALNHDMKTCMKLNNDVLAQTQREDQYDNAGATRIQSDIYKLSQKASAEKDPEKQAQYKAQIKELEKKRLQSKLAIAQSDDAEKARIQKQMEALEPPKK